MKSRIIKQEEIKERSYPYIGIDPHNDLVILFSEPGKGTVLHQGITSYKIGAYSSIWAEKQFVPQDKITIEFEL